MGNSYFFHILTGVKLPFKNPQYGYYGIASGDFNGKLLMEKTKDLPPEQQKLINALVEKLCSLDSNERPTMTQFLETIEFLDGAMPKEQDLKQNQ